MIGLIKLCVPRIQNLRIQDGFISSGLNYDAILLDIDNGPEAITYSDNEWLYSPGGLKKIYEKLRPEGIVAIWSARADQLFTNRLKKTGFNVRLRTVRARPGKGSRHTIFVAQKPWVSSAR